MKAVLKAIGTQNTVSFLEAEIARLGVILEQVGMALKAMRWQTAAMPFRREGVWISGK